MICILTGTLIANSTSKGNLDLTGRWPGRYTSLLARMIPFLDDIDKLRPYVTKTETTVTFSHDFTHTLVDYEISSQPLEAEFMAKYQLVGMNVEELLEKSGGSSVVLRRK